MQCDFTPIEIFFQLIIAEFYAKCFHNIQNFVFISNKYKYNSMNDGLSVYCVTWNLHGEIPRCDLHQLLGFQMDQLVERQNLPDIFMIGFQEVPLRAINMIFTEPWTASIQQVLSPWDYVQVKSIRLVGILLLVYTKRELLHRFRSVQVNYTRTGFGGMWGNKGGVSIRADIDGVSLCLVNSHLAAHYENLDQRVADYNSIIDGQRFNHQQTPDILSHDYVIWIGDLNFRIDDLTGDEINDKINATANSKKTDRFDELLAKDQLNRVRREGRAFNELIENSLTFPPSYKFFVNTDKYDYKTRKPAWTDRILYRFIPNAYENMTLKVRQSSYHSHPIYKQSDHKPVTALFHLTTILSSPMRKFFVQTVIITFLPVNDWNVNNDLKVWYTLKPGDENSLKKLSNWDWIGLYKADFMSIDEHISYVWVNAQPTRWSPPSDSLERESSSSSSSSEDDAQEILEEPYFSVTFSELSLINANRYRLVYVTQDSDVLGMSDAFQVNN